MVSQLEVNFGIVAACIPTVLKIIEEYYRGMCYLVTGREQPSKSQSRTMTSNAIPRSKLDTKGGRSDYWRFGDDEEHELSSTHSRHSRAEILTKEKGCIIVQTSFVVDNDSLPIDEKGQTGNTLHGLTQFTGSVSVAGP